MIYRAQNLWQIILITPSHWSQGSTEDPNLWCATYICRLLVPPLASTWGMRCDVDAGVEVLSSVKGQHSRAALHFFWDVSEHYSLRMGLLLRNVTDHLPPSNPFWRSLEWSWSSGSLQALQVIEISYKILLILVLVAPQWDIEGFQALAAGPAVAIS